LVKKLTLLLPQASINYRALGRAELEAKMLLSDRKRFFRRRFFYGASLRLVIVAIGLAVGACDAQMLWAQYGVPGMPGMPGMMPYVQRSNRNNPNNPNSNSNNQYSNRGNAQPEFQGTATITGVGSQGIEVVDAKGDKWRVVPEKKNCKIEVTGTADVSFLKPDMLVRFNAQFDKKGNAAAPVDSLDIISPQAAMSATSIKTEFQAGQAQNGIIIGHIKSIKSNHLAVTNTMGTFSFDLAPNATIKVDVSEPALAQAGDKVDVQGYISQPGMAVARVMHITLSNVLGEPKKKATTKATGNANK
jgi:hypothetical protein